jgi:hypothetical protein
MKPSSEEQSTTPNAWREFWNGLIQPSAGAIVLAFALNIALFVGLTIWVDASFFKTDFAWYLATRDLDLDVYTTVDAMRMSQRQSDDPLVVVLGASATIDSVDGELLERSLHEITQRNQTVYKLTTGGQDLWDSMMLAGAIPKGSRGIVAIATPPGRFVDGRKTLESLAISPRIGVPSPWLDEELGHYGIETPYRTGIYLIDQDKFLCARVPFLLRNLVTGPIPRSEMPTIGKEPMSDEKWEERTPPLVKGLNLWPTNVEDNLQVLARLIAHLRETTEVNVLLIEPPVNPRLLREPGMDELFHRHRQRLQAFSASHDLPYVDISEEIGVIEDDFRDWFHLRNEETAAEYTVRLAGHMAALDAGEKR